MPLLTRLIAVLAALALGLAAAGCGGDDDEDSAEVPEGAIALVGEREITKAEYDRLLAQAEKTYEAREQEFPAAGTPEFAQLRSAIVRSLVEQAEFEIAAEELGVEVSDEDVETRLTELKEQFFEGDEERYEAELEKQGLTDAQVRTDTRTRVLSERIFEEVTKDVQVTDEDVRAYYEENQAQFETPASREVRHILVKQKARADDLYRQIQNGANFAALARRFSQDTASKEDGGRFTAQQGATVPEFDETAFELETGEVSRPVKTQFGWHIIEATSAVKPKSAQELEQVEEQIREQLLEQKRNARINEWVEELRTRFEDEVVYAPGYEPQPLPETSTGAGDTGGADTGSQTETGTPTETE
ncbi:MAG TPA: peptidylprolyl isomerase [Gaiellaceae bacterium]|nr:peptidylprolyl isomerase [Gaiellaceae bacterium]